MPSLRSHLVSLLRLPGIRQLSSALLYLCALCIVPAKPAETFTVMQVGGRGGADPYTKWLRANGSIRTIGVEPESSGLQKLQKAKAYDFIIPQGLSDSAGSAPLYITKAKGWCSLLKPDEVAIAKVATEQCMAVRPFEVTGTEDIRLVAFDAIKDTVPPVDFLQIDVQGAELKVLHGAEQTLHGIGVIELEVRFAPIYEHEPLFPDIEAYLTKHGFTLFQMTRQGEREFGSNDVEANACFYNAAIMQSRPAHIEMLRAYAKAKHELYGDKVLRLLGDIR